ncbi:prostaglandin E synthase 3 [Leptopilina heterotoma]|uniref:prostaglandin E synthase 3 n=1 Tax=Leptopilina heterotoma TaxID=63436 RepID=UPI001CA83162|nr:prostaglandin E synthase 3 [Leptopilina heterotoma]
MTQEGQVTPPPVLWAQRNSVLYVTICLEDCANPTVKVEPEKLFFKGVGGTDKKVHEVTINFYKEIDPTKTIEKPQGRIFEFVLAKKEEGPYWPRLTKENNKFHWLKSDFNKWKDEDDSEDEETGGGAGRQDLEEMMRQMGGLSGAGDSKPNFDSLDLGDVDDEGDSDDESLPELINN